MTPYKQSGEQSRSGVRDVYVARTVKSPQDRLERFLKGVQRHLGSAAVVNTMDDDPPHLTYLESFGVKSRLLSLSYDLAGILEFKDRLQTHLSEALPSTGRIQVRLDKDNPLKWMTCRKLAFNVVADDRVLAERDEIEEFLVDEFGEPLPDLREFDAHMTVLEMLRKVTNAERKDPALLLPRGLYVPRTIDMNGLAVYRGRIADRPAIQGRL